MDKHKILREWNEYKIIMDGDYKFLMYDTLNRIANALEKIAENSEPLAEYGYKYKRGEV